ncbi:MAG: hypothetical protein ACYDBB_26675 [Armatimonadota bacterium]
MRFFTREFVAGELTDAEVDSICISYQRHIDAIVNIIPVEIAELAQTSLHDGLLCRAVVKPNANELLLSLRCGDLQIGYYDIDIHYYGVVVDTQLLEVLSRRARDRHTEILAGEIDIKADGRFVHRLIFWPDDEVEIVFSSIHLVRQSRLDRKVVVDEEPYIEIRDQ